MQASDGLADNTSSPSNIGATSDLSTAAANQASSLLTASKRSYACHQQSIAPWSTSAAKASVVVVGVKEAGLSSLVMPELLMRQSMKAGTTLRTRMDWCGTTILKKRRTGVRKPSGSRVMTADSATTGVAFTSKMISTKQAGKHNYRFQKVFTDGDFMACGLLEIPPNEKKPLKPSKDNTFVGTSWLQARK